jgi:hypothetical protein
MSRAFGTGDDVFEWWRARLPTHDEALLSPEPHRAKGIMEG